METIAQKVIVVVASIIVGAKGTQTNTYIHSAEKLKWDEFLSLGNLGSCTNERRSACKFQTEFCSNQYESSGKKCNGIKKCLFCSYGPLFPLFLEALQSLFMCSLRARNLIVLGVGDMRREKTLVRRTWTSAKQRVVLTSRLGGGSCR